MRKPVVFMVAALALAGAACGKSSPTSSGSPSPSASPTTPLGPSTPPPVVKAQTYKALTTDKAPGDKEPVVTIPSGAPPTTLRVTDLTAGSGAAAQSSSTISVNYLLFAWDDKQKIAGSFGDQPLVSPLGGLIEGWKQGLLGMKVGGRRQLIIPPALGYGPAGSGHQLAGKTLVFIVDLLEVS